MELETALKTLQESMGSFTYPIYIPTEKATKDFKLMTTSDFLSVGKQSNLGTGFDYEITLLSLIKKLCASDIDVYKLTDFDRMKILLGIFYNNNNDISTVTFECKDEACRKDLKYKVDIAALMGKIDNPLDIMKSYSIGNLKIDITYGAPIYINSLCFYKNLEEDLRLVTNEEDKKKVEDDFKRKLPLLYIKKVVFNGEEIDFNDAPKEKKQQFLTLIPQFVYEDIDKILAENSFDMITKVTDSITCECGDITEVEIDLEDFFR